MGCAWTMLLGGVGLAWATPQVEPGWWVDASSTEVGSWAVRQGLPCQEHDGTLGLAVVVYSRKQGTMAWGHASMRAVGCEGGEPFDHEYETYVVSRGNWPEIERVLAGDPVLHDDAYWREQKGRLFVFRNDDPVDAGFYADSHDRNREIYELWLDREPDELDRMRRRLEDALSDQADRIEARADLEGRYKVLDTNCTLPMQLLLDRGWHLPFRWLRELEDEAQLRVLHPSRHLIARWGEVPLRVERRPRPVFRRRGSGGPVGGPGPILPVDGGWPPRTSPH